MDSLSVDGNTTVVDGPSPHVDGRPSTLYKPTSKASKPTRSDHTRQQFGESADYLEQDRPFCVSIGKDGLIAALGKLDDQLRKVRSSYHMYITVWRSVAENPCVHLHA